MKPIHILLLLATARTQEVTTPARLLGPRNFNHHPYENNQYLLDTNRPKPTKQGPVLFPENSTPPPRTPLIVTSRPLTESIAKSELNSSNTVAESSQINPVFRPGYLAKYNLYKPFQFTAVTGGVPYADLVEKNRRQELFGSHQRFDDTEPELDSLPPVYKAFADHAKQNLKDVQKGPNYFNVYKVKEAEGDYPSSHHRGNDIENVGRDSDYDQSSNYAFSYTVKDKKTGDDFSHKQQSSGSATNGEYRVRLPDGRMQIVSYTADENGYNANVRYDEEHNNIENNFDPNNINDYSIKTNDYIQQRSKPLNSYSRNNKYDVNSNYVPINDNDNDINDYSIKNNNYLQQRNEPLNRHISNINHDTGIVYNTNGYDNLKPKIYTPLESTHTKPIKNEFNHPDISQEYNEDYTSLEYDGKYDDYEPHKSKFQSFYPTRHSNLDSVVIPSQVKTNGFPASTVKPSYEELKYLFVTKKPSYNAQALGTEDYSVTKFPLNFNAPSTTPGYDVSTENNVVIIGKTNPKSNLYTNVISSTIAPLSNSETPSYLNELVNNNVPVSTPSGYLHSTIASLRRNVDLSGPKPILSNSYINRINKYLSLT